MHILLKVKSDIEALGALRKYVIFALLLHCGHATSLVGGTFCIDVPFTFQDIRGRLLNCLTLALQV